MLAIIGMQYKHRVPKTPNMQHICSRQRVLCSQGHIATSYRHTKCLTLPAQADSVMEPTLKPGTLASSTRTSIRQIRYFNHMVYSIGLGKIRPPLYDIHTFSSINAPGVLQVLCPANLLITNCGLLVFTFIRADSPLRWIRWISKD